MKAPLAPIAPVVVLLNPAEVKDLITAAVREALAEHAPNAPSEILDVQGSPTFFSGISAESLSAHIVSDTDLISQSSGLSGFAIRRSCARSRLTVCALNSSRRSLSMRAKSTDFPHWTGPTTTI